MSSQIRIKMLPCVCGGHPRLIVHTTPYRDEWYGECNNKKCDRHTQLCTYELDAVRQWNSLQERARRKEKENEIQDQG